MNHEKQTLVILTPGFPESEADTTCLPMQQGFVKALKENYPQLDIIVLSFQYPFFKKKYEWFDIPVIAFNGHNKGGLSGILLRRKLNTALKQLHDHTKISGILSFWCGECAMVGKSFADRHNIKHYCWILGQDARKENKYPKHIHVKPGELIALSDFLQEEFERSHNIRPMHVVPFGIDLRQFSNSTKKKDIDILGVGSLIPLKRYQIFVEVIAEIVKEFPQAKAMLIGTGPENKKLQDLISKYGVEENLMLTGELSYNKVLHMMQRTKLLLHPSSYEGFSGVCLEALSGGAHVISFTRAMKSGIAHWHIAQNKEEMIQKALRILKDSTISHEPVMPFTMNGTAQNIMELFAG